MADLPTDRVRAYLDARATSGTTLATLGDVDTCDGHTLTELDLEIVLRMVNLLADLSVPRPFHVDRDELLAWAHDQVLGTTMTFLGVRGDDRG